MSNRISRNKIKTWLVTGASSGLGAIICKELLERNYNVIALARRKPTFNNQRIYSLSCDITDETDVMHAVDSGIDRFGSIDVLINNAGISSNYTLEESTNEDLHKIFETNFFGTCNITRICLKYFRLQGHGTVVNNTSQSGLSGRLFGCGYCSSKHALEGLTSVLSIEAQKFCRVMAVEYGWFPGTDICKSATTTKTKFYEYQIKDKFSSIYNDFYHEINTGVNYLINQIEKEELPRHLILGFDAIEKVKHEINLLQKDISISRKRALFCAYPKNKNFYRFKYLPFISYRMTKGGVLYSFFDIPLVKLSPFQDISLKNGIKKFIKFILPNHICTNIKKLFKQNKY